MFWYSFDFLKKLPEDCTQRLVQWAQVSRLQALLIDTKIGISFLFEQFFQPISCLSSSISVVWIFPCNSMRLQTLCRSNSFWEEHKLQVLLWRSSCCGPGSCSLLGIDLYTEAPGYLHRFCPLGSFLRLFCLDYCDSPRPITACVILKWPYCILWRQNSSLTFLLYLLVLEATVLDLLTFHMHVVDYNFLFYRLCYVSSLVGVIFPLLTILNYVLINQSIIRKRWYYTDSKCPVSGWILQAHYFNKF